MKRRQTIERDFGLAHDLGFAEEISLKIIKAQFPAELVVFVSLDLLRQQLDIEFPQHLGLSGDTLTVHRLDIDLHDVR